MTIAEVITQFGENIKNNKPYIGGALGDMEGCSAYEEETIRDGMWRTKYLGNANWFKEITDNDIIDRVTITKRAFKEIVRLCPLRLDKILISFWNIYTCEGGLKSKELKFENFCPTCQEIIRAGSKDLNEIVLKSKVYPYYTFAKLDLIKCAAMSLQFSTTYRAMAQDILGEVDKEALNKSYLREILRLKNLFLSRVNGDMKKMQFLSNAFILVALFKKKTIKNFLNELDIDKVKFDKEDWYYVLRRSSYDYRGLSIEDRLKEAQRRDKKQGNILLGL
jgi:hypothetical protein